MPCEAAVGQLFLKLILLCASHEDLLFRLSAFIGWQRGISDGSPNKLCLLSELNWMASFVGGVISFVGIAWPDS